MWHPYQPIGGSEIPLAPILPATLSNPDRKDDRIYELNAFLDTGADVTLIPLEAISVLRLPLLEGKISVIGVGGAVTIGFPCRVTLQFGKIRLSLIKVISCEAAAIGKQGQMIVGRDILNQFCVRFDGKRQQFSFEED